MIVVVVLFSDRLLVIESTTQSAGSYGVEIQLFKLKTCTRTVHQIIKSIFLYNLIYLGFPFL